MLFSYKTKYLILLKIEKERGNQIGGGETADRARAQEGDVARTTATHWPANSWTEGRNIPGIAAVASVPRTLSF